MVLDSPRTEMVAGELEEEKTRIYVYNVAVDNGYFQEKTVQVLTPGDQTTPSQLSEPTVNGSKSAEAGYAVMFPAEETKDIDLVNKFLLSPQKAMCSDELQDKKTKFLALKNTTGRRYNAEVRNREECWNPDILGDAVTYQCVDDEGSCFRNDLFDPHGYDQGDFHKEIEVDMRCEKEKKEQNWHRSQKIDFLSEGTQPGTFLTPKINLPILDYVFKNSCKEMQVEEISNPSQITDPRTISAEVDMRREKEKKVQKWHRSQKIDLLSEGTQPGTFLTPKISLPIPAVPGRGSNVITSLDTVACDCWKNKKSMWDTVSFNLCSNAKISQAYVDSKILLPTGRKDFVSAALAHATLLAAANACSEYSAYSHNTKIFATQDGTVYPVDISSRRVLSQKLPLGVEDSGIMALPRGDTLARSDGVSKSLFLSVILPAFYVLIVTSFFSHLLNKVQATTAERKLQKPRKRKGQEEMVTFREVGKLSVSNKEIGKGSDGTIVLEGVLREDKHRVAIKRLLRSHFDVLPREVESLRAANAHPNIVRYYFIEEDDDFLYLALERCTCSLHDLITSFSDYEELLHEDTNNQPLLKPNGYPSPLLLKLMRDIVHGLAYLHKLGILHRDLKPKNVLVQKDGVCCAKLSFMGISKRLPADMSSTSNPTDYGSRGWQAPEQLLDQSQTCAVDVFNLGLLFYFCMTGGRHPFGERRFEQDFYIVHNKRDLSLINHIPEAADLVSSLLDPVPTLRPKAVQVLDHPFFWDAETRLSFIRDASDRFHIARKNQERLLLQELETTAQAVFSGGNWSTSLDSLYFRAAGARKKYKVKKVHSLLRLIRNTINHSGEFPNDVQSIIGKVADEIDAYFSTRYPRLIMEVYKILYSNCLEEPKLSKYF